MVAAILVVATFEQYGVTWDEDAINWYGVFVLDYYLSFFHDLRALNWLDLTNYGGLFDMTAAAINRVSPFGTYETRHLLNGFVGILGLVGVWRLGRTLGGARCGFIAALFLVLMPNYYGEMFNNPKDIPFAVGMVWSLYLIVRILPGLPRPPLADVAKLGLAIGLAMAIRVGGLMIFGYVGLVLLLSALWRARAERRWGAFIADGWIGLWRVLVPAFVVAYPVMLLFWPWAQAAPFTNPLVALAAFSHQIFPYPTLFDGALHPSRQSAVGISAGSHHPEAAGARGVPAGGGARGGVARIPPRARAAGAGADDRAFHRRLRHPLSGLLRHRHQGDPVRRHAAFHLRAAAHRLHRGTGRRPRARPPRAA